MAAHNCTLFDEVHRILFLGVNLSGDAQREIRIKFKTIDGVRKHFLEISSNGSKEELPLCDGGLKIPPDTGTGVLFSRFVQLAETGL